VFEFEVFVVFNGTFFTAVLMSRFVPLVFSETGDGFVLPAYGASEILRHIGIGGVYYLS